MELDEVLPSSHASNIVNYYRNEDIHSIGNKVQTMQIDDEADMVDSDESGFASGRNVPGVNSSKNTQETEELSESAKAFQQFQKEREDTTFSRNCLFCKKHFTGNRSLLLNHLAEQHNFFLGHPDNLVYINEFLDILENMLNKLQCFYCEKFFKDWSALKEHMRKKMHKVINPDNKAFDKFYMLNYLNNLDEVNVTCHDAEEETEIEIEPKDNSIICLFCDCEYSDFDEIMNHLKVIHGFDFRRIKKQFKLCFYSQVKLINYIRRKVLVNECIICDTPFKSKEALSKHLTTSSHIKILPPQGKWNQSEYFFSTLETDYLLCGLQDDDDDDDENDDSNVEIISEDIILPKTSVLIDENLRRELLL